MASEPPRRRRKRLLAAAVGLLLAGVVLGVAYWRGAWRPFEPDPKRFPTWGVDVSHHQGPIDWAKLRSGDPRIAFAYLKATEGGDWTDPTFGRHWRDAKAVGLKVGAYHFFTFCRPPADQLAHFLATVPNEADALPPAIDVEFGGNCRNLPPREELQRNVVSFLADVERATGRRPILYVTQDAWDALLVDAGVTQPVWLRSIYREPRVDSDPAWTLWQFDPRGRLPGVGTYIDLNAFRGTVADLERL